MRIDCVGIKPQESMKGTVIGAGLGATAGVAYNIYDAKPLLGKINRNLDKIQIKHPNITGKWHDVFKSYLKTDKNTGNKGIVFLKNNKEIAKRAGIIGGIVVACAAAGTIIGSAVDKIVAKNRAKKEKEQLQQQKAELAMALAQVIEAGRKDGSLNIIKAEDILNA